MVVFICLLLFLVKLRLVRIRVLPFATSFVVVVGGCGFFFFFLHWSQRHHCSHKQRCRLHLLFHRVTVDPNPKVQTNASLSGHGNTAYCVSVSK